MDKTEINNQKFIEIQQNVNKTKKYYMFIFIYIIILTILIIYNIYKIDIMDKKIKNEFKKQIDDNFANTINIINKKYDEINKKYDEINKLDEKKLNEILLSINNKFINTERNIQIIMNKYNDQYFEHMINKISTDIYKNIDIIDVIKGTYTSIKNNSYLIIDIYKADEYFSKINDNETLIHNNQSYKVKDLKNTLNYLSNTNQILIKILIADLSQINKKINEKYILIQKNNNYKPFNTKSIYNPSDKYNHHINANIFNEILTEVV